MNWAAAAVIAALLILVTDWPRQWIISVTSSMLVMEAVTLYIVKTGSPGAAPSNNPSPEQPRPRPTDLAQL